MRISAKMQKVLAAGPLAESDKCTKRVSKSQGFARDPDQTPSSNGSRPANPQGAHARARAARSPHPSFPCFLSTNLCLKGAARVRESRVPAPLRDVFHWCRPQHRVSYSSPFALPPRGLLVNNENSFWNKIFIRVVPLYGHGTGEGRGRVGFAGARSL